MNGGLDRPHPIVNAGVGWNLPTRLCEVERGGGPETTKRGLQDCKFSGLSGQLQRTSLNNPACVPGTKLGHG